MDTSSFESTLLSDGFGSIETKQLPPAGRNTGHAHPFEVRALVIEGQIALTFSGEERTYRKGEVFTMAAGCEHTEEVGAEGVRYLVGRRPIPA